MAKLRVGMITCWYKDIAMSNYSGHLKSELEKLGVDVEIVTSSCLCEERYCGNSEVLQSRCRYVSWPLITFPRISRRELRWIMWFPQGLYQMLRGIRYLNKCRDCDIIHYQQSPPFSFGMLPLVGLLLVPTAKIKIVTLHWFDQFMARRLSPFLNKLYSQADLIIVHSKRQKIEAVGLGLPQNRIEVVRHGIPHSRHFGVRRREITFFGAPTQRKGFFTILEALKILRNQGRPVRISVYGIYSEKEKEDAAAAAQSLDVGDLVSWGGRLSEDEFDRKMQESLFTFALYSMSIPGSSIITRALSNATPVVASNTGGSEEYLGEAGITIPPDDPATLARTMTTLLDDRTPRGDVGEKWRIRSCSFFSWSEVAKKTLGIYVQSIRSKARAGRNDTAAC